MRLKYNNIEENIYVYYIYYIWKNPCGTNANIIKFRAASRLLWCGSAGLYILPAREGVIERWRDGWREDMTENSYY